MQSHEYYNIILNGWCIISKRS